AIGTVIRLEIISLEFLPVVRKYRRYDFSGTYGIALHIFALVYELKPVAFINLVKINRPSINLGQLNSQVRVYIFFLQRFIKRAVDHTRYCLYLGDDLFLAGMNRNGIPQIIYDIINRIRLVYEISRFSGAVFKNRVLI